MRLEDEKTVDQAPAKSKSMNLKSEVS